MKRTLLTDLPPEYADTVRAFRAEMIAEREEQTSRLRATFDQLKRELEIEKGVMRRMTELFKSTTAL